MAKNKGWGTTTTRPHLGEFMKLSDAIMLGSSTCKMVKGDWNSCALGAAANAVGIKKIGFRDLERINEIEKTWPWLLYTGGMLRIAILFDNKVCSGQMTLEQLVDFVRSIEPDCGECNRFECTCKKEKSCPAQQTEHERVIG